MSFAASWVVLLAMATALLLGVGLIVAALSGKGGRPHTLRCAHCHEQNRDDAHFCARCGKPLFGDPQPPKH